MTESQASHPFAQAVLRWRDLIDRRCAHFIDLHRSGRWKHYYGEAQFLALMREAVDLAVAWSEIAPRPDETRSGEPRRISAVGAWRKRRTGA